MSLAATWLSWSSLGIPRYLARSAWHQHAPFAEWLIETHRPASLVELGTYSGFSYAAFCDAVQRNGLPTRCSAIDTWRGDEHAGFYGEQVFTAFRKYHDARYAAFSQLIRATFDDALATFPDRSIDLLHIDGRHLYEDALHDFSTWRPKLSARAIVLFHDTAVLTRNFGVHRLWKELSATYPHFQFTHGHGLGVLGVGDQRTQALIDLYAAEGTDEGQRIRSTYAHLGRAISDHYESARLKAAMSEREKEIDRLRKVIAATDNKSMPA
ncbi:MAG: class I SAM-dependent methyltransferase [Bauldia sp.]